MWSVMMLIITLCPGCPGSPLTPDSPDLPEFPWTSQTTDRGQRCDTKVDRKLTLTERRPHSPLGLGSLYVPGILWVPAGRPPPEHSTHTKLSHCTVSCLNIQTVSSAAVNTRIRPALTGINTDVLPSASDKHSMENINTLSPHAPAGTRS